MQSTAPRIRGSFVLLTLLVLSACGGSDSEQALDTTAQVDSERSKLFFDHDFPSYSVGDLPGQLPEEEQGGITVIDYPPEQPFGCRGGQRVQGLIVNAPTSDLLIDGGGRERCIQVETGCTTLVRAKSITLTNCRYCIDLIWGGILELNAVDGSISCDSLLDSVRVRGGSSATLNATGDVSLVPGQRDSALRLGWDSTITINAQGSCHMEGNPPIRITGNGTVVAERCSSPQEEDSNSPEPTSPDPEPVPDFEPGPDPLPTTSPPPVAVQTDDPIVCRSGSLAVNDPASDLFIDGRGRSACIRVQRGCIANVRARNITLTNCRECVQATRGATLELTAVGGNISCDSIRDAIRVDGGSTVQLRSDGDLTLIAAGRNRRNDGIQATRSSAVSLSTPGTCRIEAVGNAINAPESGSVDTSGCGQLHTAEGSAS